MTDLAKCSGIGCKIRLICRRYVEPSLGDGQTWMAPKVAGKNCQDFLPVRPDADSRHAVEVGGE